VSGINGGTNTTTAGTRTAIGTSTTTTKQLWSAPFQGFAGLLAIDRHNSLTGFRRPLIRFTQRALSNIEQTYSDPSDYRLLNHFSQYLLLKKSGVA